MPDQSVMPLALFPTPAWIVLLYLSDIDGEH